MAGRPVAVPSILFVSRWAPGFVAGTLATRTADVLTVRCRRFLLAAVVMPG